MPSSDDDFKEGVHFYYNGNNFLVFTEKYHLQRGYCCGNGCTHCPYDFENVPEPLKNALRQAKKNGQENPKTS